VIFLDTHVIVWLYARGARGLPAALGERLEREDDIRISPMVRLELQYLKEIKRLNVAPATILDELTFIMGLMICDTPFSAITRQAELETWTRDPFDRIIVAQARLHGAPLVSKDETIRANYPLAVWE